MTGSDAGWATFALRSYAARPAGRIHDRRLSGPEVDRSSGIRAAAFRHRLPAENATGNFVKIVQRVPVKILVDHWPDDLPIGPGLSVVPWTKVK
jgi:membrane fusion protein (multidrug efflux system)